RHKCSFPLWGSPGVGHQQGLITAERERLNFGYANAVAEVQNRNAQRNSRVEEAHINLSVRESNIAGAGNQVLELQQQLEADRAQLREREFNLGRLTAQLQEREARHDAQQPRCMRRRRGGTRPPPLETLPTMA
ncbi:putative glycine dehydrogenase, putative,glycine cleavage system P-protein, partial [Trypanosoma cruzi]